MELRCFFQINLFLVSALLLQQVLNLCSWVIFLELLQLILGTDTST